MACACEISLAMRILLVTGSYPPSRCGVGDYTYNLAEALHADPRINVGILTSYMGTSSGKVGGVEVFAAIKSWKFKEVLTVIKNNSWLVS